MIACASLRGCSHPIGASGLLASQLALAMVRWAVHEDQAPAVPIRMPVPPLVLLTKSQMQRIFLLIEVLLPLSVIAVGTLVWWRRR